MKNLLFFDAMITPKIITFIYWLILLGVVVGGLGVMFGGAFLQGVGILVGGALFARIWCELLMVLFKINENLQKLTDAKQA